MAVDIKLHRFHDIKEEDPVSVHVNKLFLMMNLMNLNLSSWLNIRSKITKHE